MTKKTFRILRRQAAAAFAAVLLVSALGMAAPSRADASAGAESAPAPAVRTVTIDTHDVLQDDFLGVGVNVIPTALMPGQTQFGYNETYWAMDRKRIETIEPAVARVWFQIDWMEPEKGVYTWDSMEMKAFYRYLDAFKAAGTEIELNFGWKVGSKVHDWFTFPGVSQSESAPADLDAYAASASNLLQELILNRGYDNIKYLTFYNEPNGSWDFELPGDQQAYYADMVRTTSERLATDGIRDLVEIWGPEESGAPLWTKYMKDHIDEHVDGYSFHVYGESYDGLGAAFDLRRSYVGDKPIHLTEFGWADDNASNWNAGYANSVIQAANKGVKSALMWQLNGVWSYDPYGGTNGTYTMWDALVLGLEPRKTFYVAGMLNRYIPKHGQVVAVDTGGAEDIRAAAFKSENGNYTILLETKAGAAKDVTFDFGDVDVGKTFRKFVFRDDVAKEANALLPAASGEFAADGGFRDGGIDGEYNVIVYTTEPAETQVEVTPINPTVRAGDKLRLNARVIDNAGGVAWSIVGDNNGAINKNTGVYHAPQVKDETLVAVKATSAADPSAYGIALVKVLPKSLPNTAEAPTFSLTQRSYPSAEALFLGSATAGAQIRYTTDGSEPTEQSSLYTRPIILKDGTLVYFKAKAFKPGLKPSGTTTAFYQIGQVSNAPDGYQFCMYEGQGDCAFEGEAIVAYGADGLFNYAVHTNGVACGSDVFGDPAPGQAKRCFYSTDIPDELPVVTFFNGGFEKPATTSARPGPMSNGWDFSDRAGVQHNGGPFQPTPAPQGTQTAYLKTDGGVAGWFGQSINFKPGSYQLSFKAAKRTSFGGTQSFDVYFDDQVIGSFRPDTGAYETFKTEPFATDGGRHTIKFQATTTAGDNTAFVDDVRISLPEAPPAASLANASFESPVATGEGRILTGISAGWQFDGASGIVRNGNALGSANAPLGVQAAYVGAENGVQGAFSQTLTLPAGVYAVRFQAAGSDNGTATIDVKVNGASAGSFAPAASSYGPYETEWFAVEEEGAYTIAFEAVGAGNAFIDGVSIERILIPAQAELSNGSFETPAVTASHGVLVGGSAGGWTFNNFSGLIRNGSVFDTANAPDGSQAAYLQTLNGTQGAFAQETILPAGQYVVKFEAAKRTSFGGQQSFGVYLDDTAIGTYTPATGTYAPYRTNPFAIDEPGRHTIRFAATTTSGDNTAFVDNVRIEPYAPPATPQANNAGFESPVVTASYGTKWNFVDGWTFNTHAGVARNGSVLEQPAAPEGAQVAYLQTNNGQGVISQSIEFGAGTYTIGFSAARRSFGGQQAFDVLVDGIVVGSYAPTSKTAFAPFATQPFTVSAGFHTVSFAATTTTGDNTAFIDDFRIQRAEG